MMSRRLLSFLWLACGLACGSRALAEEAPEAGSHSIEGVAECVGAHERASMLRLEERWEDAQKAMQACASDACPLAIRSDCTRWLEEVAQMLPSLIVVIERDDEGRDPVRLSLNGRELTLSEPVQPIEVLPGTHRLEFRLPPYAPLSYEISVRVGEKNKVVRVSFERERKTVSQPLPQPLPARDPAPSTTPARPVPTITYLLAAGAVLAAGTSGGLLAAALSRRETARERCAPGCYDGQRKEVDRLLLGADLAAAGSLAFAGFAVYTFVSRPTLEVPAKPRAGFSLTPAPGVSLSGRF